MSLVTRDWSVSTSVVGPAAAASTAVSIRAATTLVTDHSCADMCTYMCVCVCTLQSARVGCLLSLLSTFNVSKLNVLSVIF